MSISIKKTGSLIPMGKASLLALWIAAGFSPQAQAQQQSNVTVYGYIDIAIQDVGGYSTGNVNVASVNTQRTTAMAEGYRNWLGFKGREDLGDGWAATFNLEERFYLANGQIGEPGVLFHGESTVGLASDTLGAFRFGMGITPMWSWNWRYDPWWGSSFAGSIAAYQNGSFNDDPSGSGYFQYFARQQDSVFYDSNDIGGFQVHAAAQVDVPTCFGPDCIPSQKPNRRVMGVTLTYAGGPLEAMAAYEINDVGDTIATVGSVYNIDRLTLLGTLASVRMDALYNPGAPTETDVTVGARYALDGHNTLRVGYGRIYHVAGGGANDDGAPLGGSQHKASIGDSYALSKRTNVYADLWREVTTAEPVSTGVAIGMNTRF